MASEAKEAGKIARREHVDRSLNPYSWQEQPKEREDWYEGWDEEHKTAPASSTTSTISTGNIPFG